MSTRGETAGVRSRHGVAVRARIAQRQKQAKSENEVKSERKTRSLNKIKLGAGRDGAGRQRDACAGTKLCRIIRLQSEQARKPTACTKSREECEQVGHV
eukprot:6184137-Pleurochrysis_carterae.AAC.1